MENVSETKTGTEEKSVCSETLQKLCNKTGMHFCRTEQSNANNQWLTHSKRRRHLHVVRSQGCPILLNFYDRFQRPGFSVPNRTKFVIRTETPGGFCVNCHHDKERRPERLHQRPEKPVCVYGCACARTHTHIYIYIKWKLRYIWIFKSVLKNKMPLRADWLQPNIWSR